MAASFNNPRVIASTVDVLDPKRIRNAVRDRALVINATGPLMRTGLPVIEACIDMRTPCIDFGDTHEAAVAAYTMDGAARDSGTPIVVCAGLTPGLSGVIAKYMAHGLDAVESIEFDWLTGATPKKPGVPKAGGSLVEHMIHESTGTTHVLRGGHLERLAPFRVASHKQFPEPVGDRMVYAIGHAEVVTIPHAFPGIRNVQVNGGIAPTWLAGVFQGIGKAIDEGKLVRSNAIEFIAALGCRQETSAMAVAFTFSAWCACAVATERGYALRHCRIPEDLHQQ